MQPSPIARWHEIVAARDPSRIEDLLSEDAVFLSPAVHSPQSGRDLVAKYLRAAMVIFGDPSFRYLDEWSGDRSAVLEFELTIDGIYMNGIDLIRWNDEGRIVEFKVMVRPLKGLNTAIALMGEQLRKAMP